MSTPQEFLRPESRRASSAQRPGLHPVCAAKTRFVLPWTDALTDLRARQVIGDDAFHVVEEEIDLLDLTADARVRPLPQANMGETR